MNTRLREFRCTRNALYSHNCNGRDKPRERQGHYIWAINSEAAWEEMARRFPQETKVGFTVEPWEGFDVQVVEVKRDSQGRCD